MNSDDWIGIAIITAAVLFSWALLAWPQPKLGTPPLSESVERIRRLNAEYARIRQINAETATMREQIRELDRHPAGSESGYRLAVQYAMESPSTLDDRCWKDAEHPPHLWRHVRNAAAPDVDESMRRCDGVSA